MSPGAMIRFDRFTLDPRTRLLLSDDKEIHLAPKSFELLMQLVTGRSRAISKEELQQALWPSSYVQETNLASLVAEIRRALGDSAERPRYIRTLHRFGYRFIGTVHEEHDREEAVKSPVKYWLVWDVRQIALTEGENIVGRAPDADVWIDAAGVSRHHARIRLEGEMATLEDLGSKNGTYVGGQRVSKAAALADGDQIRLGSVVVTFRIPPPTGSTESVRA
jgi:DNA-binding winged helix-turn-helix (wHTH) protein